MFMTLELKSRIMDMYSSLRRINEVHPQEEDE
jgi:hypothetical protein